MKEEDRPPLAHLQDEAAPPPGLKERVGQSLRERGLLSRPPVWGIGRRALPLAASLAFLVGGYLIGRSVPAGSPPDHRPRWALLLYESSTFTPEVPEAELVAEYSAWARGLGDQLDIGEKLSTSEEVLGASVSGEAVLGGLFIIRAASREAAIAIARTCPHLRHGGTVAVRAIEPT